MSEDVVLPAPDGWGTTARNQSQVMTDEDAKPAPAAVQSPDVTLDEVGDEVVIHG